MKFILTFDGDLPPNGAIEDKWAIRQAFHPQLEELWRIHPSLRSLKNNPILPLGAFWHLERHHSVPAPRAKFEPRHISNEGSVDLCTVITRGQRTFLPLVRENLLLKCGLKILFLRKEDAGRVYQGGDLDNRLKTLFDALSVPQANQIPQSERNNLVDDPMYCLLEDDAFITSVSVETHRLLSRSDASRYQVHLVVEVDVGVTQSKLYNTAFLGD